MLFAAGEVWVLTAHPEVRISILIWGLWLLSEVLTRGAYEVILIIVLLIPFICLFSVFVRLSHVFLCTWSHLYLQWQLITRVLTAAVSAGSILLPSADTIFPR
ncbi:hypothetical protein SKAU_G00094060 [Synaphobranchus kaupii]|uniref:Uncharacterized protein n=1 Tax=Synaphobranchus kaupii TaxID=118154 RepID=A0A9Q1J6S8_SYNKA|nr:hypothetical protein SKAU_G00094060 [Synaphobranchus kaupii]